jgi:hypothetical protein
VSMLETWEFLSYLVTVIGLPFAIIVFLMEKRKERANEDEEIYQQLSDEYADFIKLVLDHADLRLRSREPVTLNAEQQERKLLIFDLLISLFERAYLSVYEDDMGKQQRRMWQSWEDYMREWCGRPDFRDALPELLKGEDDDFAAHLRGVAQEELSRKPGTA